MKVTIDNQKTIDINEKITYYQLVNESQSNWPIVGVKVDSDIVNITDVIRKDCNITFFDMSTSLGSKIYESSCLFVFFKACVNVLGEDFHVIADYSVDKGIHFTLNKSIDKNILNQIENEMRRIVNSNYPIRKINVSRLEAIRYLEKHNRVDKAISLKYISNTYITMYDLDGTYDYFNNKLVPYTGILKYFQLILDNDKAIVLLLPKIVDNQVKMVYHPHVHNMKSFDETSKWCENLKVTMAGEINKYISDGHAKDLVLMAESYYDNIVSKVADSIAKNNKIKLIFIAGPSSSGKTTTAQKLALNLHMKGITPYTVSMDDFFINREDTPKDKDGNYDFESFETVDIKLFNETMTKLLNNEEVELPTFNFKTGKREYNGRKMKLNNESLIIVEGIHALNPKLTDDIDRNRQFKIYINPLVKMNVDDHNYVHSRDVRILRRIVRDNRTRGNSVSYTLNAMDRVNAGEVKNIFPFQDEVDVVINSSLIYELGVLKTYVEPLLFAVEEDDKYYDEALRLINFLRYFLPMPSDSVPPTSILREFIGGSSFEE